MAAVVAVVCIVYLESIDNQEYRKLTHTHGDRSKTVCLSLQGFSRIALQGFSRIGGSSIMVCVRGREEAGLKFRASADSLVIFLGRACAT